VRRLVAAVAIAGLALLGVVALPSAAFAASFSVTSTADAGSGSLRDAIALAEANAGPDTITFALPAGSVIQLLSLVTVTEALTLDGPELRGS